MAISQSLSQLPFSSADYPPASIASDPDFDARWAAWIARGRVHEQHARRRFIVWGGVFATGVAIVYALVTS